MHADRYWRIVAVYLLAFAVPDIAGAQTIVTEGTNVSADASPDGGQIAFDLLGSIWLLPANGGIAKELTNVVLPARAPRWSPSGRSLIYEAASSNLKQIWLHDLTEGRSRRLSTPQHSDQFAAWHPDGERIVFSSSGKNGAADLWELDIQTGLRWRLTNSAGSDTGAAWSANGRHLAYVRHSSAGWSLMLRRFGEPDRELLHSESAISSPSWRPDGSLITFLRKTNARYVLEMVILSEPPLARRYSDTEFDHFLSPVSWLDRQRMIYTADGTILSRRFDDRHARPVRFRAAIDNARRPLRRKPVTRSLPITTPPADRLVIRAARLFDGIHDGYREQVDVVIDGATIDAIGSRRDWPDATVLDMGNVSVLPGFIDIYSVLPVGDTAAAGAGLLAYGVTTIVADKSGTMLDSAEWHGEENPGPRLIFAGDIAANSNGAADLPFLVTLPANIALGDKPRRLVQQWQQRGTPVVAENWIVGLGLGVDLLLGADTLPASPRGRRYQDMRVAIGSGQVTLVSGLADAGTPGMQQLLNSRQARRLRHDAASVRRIAAVPRLDSERSSIVIGSKPSGLPAGLATHAELRALSAVGLSGEQVLRAAGLNAATTLRVENQIGVVKPGALADLVLVAGDPLKNVADALDIVAVIRNGRFYSLVSLLERAAPPANVE